MKIIRRHGYDRDKEVGGIECLYTTPNGYFIIWNDPDDNFSSNEIIEQIFEEGGNLILFTSENW